MDTNQRCELKEYMYNRFKNSLAREGSFKGVDWYELCTMRKFFGEFQIISDKDGNQIGVGLENVKYKYILNEKTESDFINAFAIARKKACDEFKRKDKINPLVWMGPLLCNFGG